MKYLVKCHVPRQIDVGGAFSIDDLTRTVPSFPLGHLGVAVVIILAVYHTTAVVIGVRFIGGGGDHHAEQGTQAQGQGQE